MGNRVKIKGDVTRVGNFVVRKIDTGNERFEINNTASNFKMFIYMNHPSYDMIEMALETETAYLKVWLSAVWFLITGTKDYNFFGEFFASIEGQAETLETFSKELTEEEEAELLNHLRTEHEMQEQLDSMETFEELSEGVEEEAELKKEEN